MVGDRHQVQGTPIVHCAADTPRGAGGRFCDEWASFHDESAGYDHVFHRAAPLAHSSSRRLRSRSVSIGCQNPRCTIGAQLVARAPELSSGSRSHDRLVACDQLADRGRQHEESAVDPAAVALRLLGEALDPVAFDAKAPKRLGGANGGDGRLACRAPRWNAISAAISMSATPSP